MSVQNKLMRIGTGMTALALLLGMLTGCGGGTGSGSADGSASSAKVEQVEEAYASYPRFTDKKVTEKNHTLTLSNSEKNEFAFVYTDRKSVV